VSGRSAQRLESRICRASRVPPLRNTPSTRTQSLPVYPPDVSLLAQLQAAAAVPGLHADERTAVGGRIHARRRVDIACMYPSIHPPVWPVWRPS